MRNKLLTAAMSSLVIVASYVPAAVAESPSHDGQIGELATPTTQPDPPVEPADPTPVNPGLELCLNLDNEPCEKEIDDFLDPSSLPDPGDGEPDDGDPEPDDGEPDGDPVPDDGEPDGDPEPEQPTPGQPTPGDENPGQPESQNPGTPSDPGPGASTTDIDTPRSGNPTFTG